MALIVGLIRILYMFRARDMRALAARWCLQYVGPSFSGLERNRGTAKRAIGSHF
jgi:hypothetical protein